MEIESALGFDFLQTANNYRNLLEKEMNKFELHYAQISVLILLWENDGMSQKKLASILRLSQPTINKMVKSLYQSGFVVLNQCDKDGRKMRVYLTNKGCGIKVEAINAIQSVQTEFFANLTETEQLILKQIITKLH